YRLGLGLAASLGHGFGEVGEHQREPQPRRHAQDESRGCLAVASERVNAESRGEHAAHEHHEHHRIADLLPRVELEERFDRGPPDDRRVEQRTLTVLLAHDPPPTMARCSTIGPSARAGKNVSAPTTSTVAIRSTTNNGVWVGSVPAPGGTC